MDIAVPTGAAHRPESGKGRCIMKRRDWKRGMAFLCATVLIAGSLNGMGTLQHVQAEENNLFTDGDMGDDEKGDSTDAAEFWTNPKWYFEGDTWSCTSQVKYSVWAQQTGGSGLEIDFNIADGTVCMYQQIGTLEAGTYTVTGYIKDGSKSAGTITLYHAAADGSWNVSEKQTVLTSDFAMFTDEFTIAEDASNYKVGFQITSKKDAWIYIDTLTLTKNTSDAAETTPTPVPTESPEETESPEVTESPEPTISPEVTESPAPTVSPEVTESPAPNDGILYSKTFEDGTTPSDMSDWTENWSSGNAGTSQSATGDCDANSTKVWNYYSATAQSMEATTTVTAAEAGNYKVSCRTAGENVAGDIRLSDGTDTVSAALSADGWDVYTTAGSQALSVEENTSLTITINLDFAAGGYLKIDDILLEKVGEDEITDAKKAKAEELQTLVTEYRTLNAGDYTTDTWTALEKLLEESESYLSALNGDYTTVDITAVNQKIQALKNAREALKSASIVNADIYVEKVEGITDDFIGGVDVSSYVSLKNSGVKYYDFAGNELDDQGFFNLLAESGINYVRIRVWNNPYDANANGYGGGNNDLATAVRIGQWATRAGMRVLIDFHYSDFWADPDKQQAPKAWQGLTLDEKLAEVTTFTENSIQTLLDSGVDVGMVQVGNETNNGIAGESGWSEGMLKVFAAGCDAVHTVANENNHPIKAVLHFANPEKGTYVGWAKKLAEADVNYDVFASSYYPYWHGTLKNLQNQLDTIAATYGKEVMVAETSWATTLEDGDGHDNTVRDGNNDTDMPYDFSIYGQAKELREVINTIANTTNGIGVFYWEPAWLPVQVYDADADNAEEVLQNNRAAWEQYGSGWAASYAGEYDAKDAGKWYGGSAVDNQALFDFSGHPLDTLNIFKYVKTGATTELKISVVKTTTAEAALGEEISLPEKVTVTYSNGTSSEREVTWNAEQIKTAQQNGAGDYRITGVVVLNEKEYEAVCRLTISPENILPDGGFESGADTVWTIDGNGASVKADSSNVKKGTYCLHFWADTAMNYTVTQTVTLAAGVYTFGGYLEGSTDGTEDTYEIYVSYNGQEQTASAEMNGWQNWSNPEIQDITITKDNTEITLGIRAKASANAWGAWDEMYLYKTGEVEPEPVETPAPSATPEPAETPAPSATPEPVETPAPSATPEPVETPAPSATPEPAETPAPSETPEPVETPAPSATPEPAETPVPSATSEPAGTPAPTATPAPSEDNSSSDDNTSAQEPEVDWNAVNSNVQNKVEEVIGNANINGVNMNIVCTGEVQVPVKVLESIKGSNVTLALHSGNGVAISISGQDLKGSAWNALQKIDLTVNSEAQNIPAAVVAAKKADAAKQLSVKDSGTFPVAVNIHVNVGAENSGKYANLYRYNEEKKQLEYCGTFPVTRNGQSMFALKRGGDYVVTVTATQPRETVYFTSGDYKVKAGDTLSAIAARNHMSLAELKAKNPQVKDIHKIRVGQNLNLD